VALLIALDPKVFMFDEPTAGMSVDEVPVVLDLIRQLKAARTSSILLVEHKMDVVRELSDRIIVLHNGQLVADGEPAEVIASPVVQQAYLGMAAGGRPHDRAADLEAACTRTSARTTSCTAWTWPCPRAVTVLLGRNGAGKTTTLRTVMGLWRPRQGDLRSAASASTAWPRPTSPPASPTCPRTWASSPTSR
jgi:ABC-type branched-subunit amino acid transport system ATPase component